MVLAYKTNSRRRLAQNKRNIFGVSCKDMVILKFLTKTLLLLGAIYQKVMREDHYFFDPKPRIRQIIQLIQDETNNLLRIDVPYSELYPRAKKHLPRTVFDFDRATFDADFRFRSPEDVLRVLEGLQIPAIVHTKEGYKFTGQEVMLISLKKLSYPHRWKEVCEAFPGRKRWACKAAFYWFLDFMIENWGYLILNNREYWVPHMAAQAQAILEKLRTLPREDWRIDFANALEEGGFNIFAFIDNTMIAMCRPGGPTTDGESAPRVPKLVQQSWWTGWKKLHGLKWQTVTMPNGMDFEIWGPCSVRHPDAYTLNKSTILEKLDACQAANALKFKMYGDSAYFDDDYLATGGGRGMSSVRESIEWGYRDLKGELRILYIRITV